MVVQESNSSFPSRVRGFTSLYLFKPNKRSSFAHLAGPELPDKDEVTASTCGCPGTAPAPRLLKSPPPSPSAADPAGSPPPAPPWASGSSLRPAPGSEHMASRPPAGPRPSHAPLLGPPISRALDAHRTLPGRPTGRWWPTAEGLRPRSRARARRALWGPHSGAGGLSLPRAGRHRTLGGQEEGRAQRARGAHGVLAHLASLRWPFGPETQIVTFREVI